MRPGTISTLELRVSAQPTYLAPHLCHPDEETLNRETTGNGGAHGGHIKVELLDTVLG